MASEERTNRLRTFIVLFNVLILIAAIVLMACAVFALYGKFYMKDFLGTDKYLIAMYIFMAAGGLVSLGCHFAIGGAVRKNRCMLIFYSVYMTAMLCFLLTGSIIALVYRPLAIQPMKKYMLHTLTHHYGLPERTNITAPWDLVQEQFQCCGVSDEQGRPGWQVWRQSEWNTQNFSNHAVVPRSCCKSQSESFIQKCQKFNNSLPGASASEFIFETGCAGPLYGFIDQQILINAGVAIVICTLLVFSLPFVFWMCARVAKHEEKMVSEAIQIKTLRDN